MNIKKKIEGTLVKESDSIEFSELFIVILKLRVTHRQKDIEETKKQYKQYETLNPRYSEKIIPLKQAKLKVDASDIIYSSKYNISRSY